MRWVVLWDTGPLWTKRYPQNPRPPRLHERSRAVSPTRVSAGACRRCSLRLTDATWLPSIQWRRINTGDTNVGKSESRLLHLETAPSETSARGGPTNGDLWFRTASLRMVQTAPSKGLHSSHSLPPWKPSFPIVLIMQSSQRAFATYKKRPL